MEAITGNEALTRDLYSKIDEHIIHHSQSAKLGTMYWYAPLNDENKSYFAPKVGDVIYADFLQRAEMYHRLK